MIPYLPYQRKRFFDFCFKKFYFSHTSPVRRGPNSASGGKFAEKEGKTEYLVFFKAKDVDVMTAAFKEYTGVSLKKEQRQSIRKKLEQAKERVAKHREITKEKMKDRGQVR